MPVRPFPLHFRSLTCSGRISVSTSTDPEPRSAVWSRGRSPRNVRISKIKVDTAEKTAQRLRLAATRAPASAWPQLAAGTVSRHLQQIGPMTAGLAIQATTGLNSLPISPWAGLGVLAAWAAGALLLGGLLLRLRDA